MPKKTKNQASENEGALNQGQNSKQDKKNKRQITNLKYLQHQLYNIIQVTEENYTHRLHEEISETTSLTTEQPVHQSILTRSIKCLSKIFQCLKPTKQISMVVKEDELLKTIEKLRSQKIIDKPYLPQLGQKKKTLVLDLDGTLLFSTFNEPEQYDFKCELPFKNSTVHIYTQLRFGVESFLFEMSKIYEIVLYTVRKEAYTSRMLEVIDKKHWISHVLHKDKCITLNRVHHLKSLKVLGRNPGDVIFLDHDPVSGILQPENFCQLKCFSGEKNDRQLIKIMPFLKELALKKSVTPVYKHLQQFRNRQIQLKFLNLECPSTQTEEALTYKKHSYREIAELQKQNHSLQDKKKKYGHKRTNSEVETLTKKTDDGEEDKEITEHEESGCQLKIRINTQI